MAGCGLRLHAAALSARCIGGSTHSRIPDPAKQAAFEVESKFYLDRDPAIALARAIHRGEKVTPREVREATSDDVNQSIYGQALELSMRYLRAATAYWRGAADALVAPNAYKPAWQVEAH